MAFTPPNRAERERAVGPLEGVAPRLQRAFTPAGDFEPTPLPGHNDWLANHPEVGQTYEAWQRSERVQPNGQRRTIYLQPLGQFDNESPAPARLQHFAEVFFGLPVRLLPTVGAKIERVTRRTNPYTGRTQRLTTDLLALLRRRLPKDAFCILGITMESPGRERRTTTPPLPGGSAQVACGDQLRRGGALPATGLILAGSGGDGGGGMVAGAAGVHYGRQIESGRLLMT